MFKRQMAQTTNTGTFGIQKYAFMVQILSHSLFNKWDEITEKVIGFIGILSGQFSQYVKRLKL